MNHRFPQFSQRRNRPWQPGWILSILLLLGILTSSTALGNHFNDHHKFDIHKSDEGAWYSQDPTLQQFLSPQTPPNPQSQKLTHSDAAWPPSHNSPSPQSKTPSAQDPVIPTVEQGWTFLLKGNPAAALSVYRQTLSRQPHSSHALLGLGMTLKSLGKIQEAKEAMTQALELDPQLASALVHLGYLYADQPSGASDPDTARRLFQKAGHMGDPFARIALLDLKNRTGL